MEWGLTDYKARFYDPTIGRFIQPDGIIPGGSASQSLNRYSYVFNSPTNATDPSGNEPNWKLRKLRAGYGHFWKQYSGIWHRGGTLPDLRPPKQERAANPIHNSGEEGAGASDSVGAPPIAGGNGLDFTGYT